MTILADKFTSILQADGLTNAMRWLNQREPYRYTAIFAFDGDILRNICFIDKENNNANNCADQSITDSYCMYIKRTAERFAVETALEDRRVDGHPKQQSLQSYYGVPLFGSTGRMLGTVCHFDTVPIPLSQETAETLDDVAPLISHVAF